MSRKDLYQTIVKNNFQEDIKKVYGKHYTNCKSLELELFLNEALTPKACKNPCKKSCKKDRLEILVNILKDKHILLPSEVTKILG